MIKQSRAFIYRFILICFSVFLAGATGWTQPAPGAGNGSGNGKAGTQRYALVIGNSDYPFIKLPEAAENSANIAQALLARNFEVITINNATENQMEAGLREFARRLNDQQGESLFYFAGHTAQFNNVNYLLPVDIELQQEYELESAAVSLTQILNVMRYTKNRRNIVVLDTGYKGPISANLFPSKQGLASLSAAQLPDNTLLALATEPDTTIFDPGLYSLQLATELQKPNLPMSRLLEDLKNNIVDATSEGQKPWMISTLAPDADLKPGAAAADDLS